MAIGEKYDGYPLGSNLNRLLVSDLTIACNDAVAIAVGNLGTRAVKTALSIYCRLHTSANPAFCGNFAVRLFQKGHERQRADAANRGFLVFFF